MNDPNADAIRTHIIYSFASHAAALRAMQACGRRFGGMACFSVSAVLPMMDNPTRAYWALEYHMWTANRLHEHPETPDTIRGFVRGWIASQRRPRSRLAA